MAGYDTGAAMGDGQLYRFTTPSPSVTPSPTATFCVFADESDTGNATCTCDCYDGAWMLNGAWIDNSCQEDFPDSGFAWYDSCCMFGSADGLCCEGSTTSIGEGWSDSGLKREPDYGYIHGSCFSGCGLFGGSGVTTVDKTFTLSSHTQASVSMRVWKEGTFDGWETVEILADGATVWQSGALEHECIAGWTNPNNEVSNINCHDASYVCFIDVDVTFAHTASTLTIGFKLNGDEDCSNEGVGFSEFVLEVDGIGGSCAPTPAPTSSAPSMSSAPTPLGYAAISGKGCMDYIHMDGGYYGTSEYMTGGSISLGQCAAAVRAYDGTDGCMGDYFFYESAGYCACERCEMALPARTRSHVSSARALSRRQLPDRRVHARLRE